MEKKANFLSNSPQGIDLLDGQSQDIVAEAIKCHMIGVDANEEDNIPRIIGVEGSWGSGKSNMLILLHNKIKANYYFFTYDAWGNQEDLQRRSILEQLTDDLIQKNLLEKDTEISVFNTNIDEEPTQIPCSWKKRLFSLVSRKTATHNVTIPRIEDSVKWFALSLLFVGIMAALVSSTVFVDCVLLNFFIICLLSILPFLAFCILRYYKNRQQKKGKSNLRGWEWKEMWKMYQTEGTQDTTTYTVSELEPSVSEFRKWMNDLANSLKENTRLVIVFDNMDRLPREKVRLLWSSIQTFFAGKEYSKVWCIIPFDREHLANAFAGEATELEDKEKLTNHFIEKTFPVVYRIPAPIITDYRGVFKELFEKAFRYREEQDLINRCYRLKYPIPNMREMICFINNCVSLCHMWNDEIRLMSIALFEINKDILFKDNKPDEVIINGTYMGLFESIIEKDETLPVEISTLVYGVPKIKSAQLPLRNLIEKALANRDAADFEQYAKEQPEFFVILDEVTRGMEPEYLDNAISHISTIKREGIGKENLELLDVIWDRLGNTYINRTQSEKSFRNEVRLLIDSCSNQTIKEKIANRFIELFTDEKNNEHTGDVWYNVYKDFGDYVNGCGLNVALPEKILDTNNFFNYVITAQNDYTKYPISCNDNEDMNAVTIEWINEGKDIANYLQLMKGDERYNFSTLFNSAKEMIEGRTATNNNVGAILNVCKILSDQPLKLNIDRNYITQLTATGDVLYDIHLLRALEGIDISGVDDSHYEEMAKIAYCYTDTYGIWGKTLTYRNSTMVKVMGWLIKNNKHKGQPNEEKDIITEMANIKNILDISYQSLITFVNDWGKVALNNNEKKAVLSNVFVGEDWLKAFLAVENPLSRAILDKYYKDFIEQPISSLMNPNNGWIANSYWLRTLNILVDDERFIEECSRKVIEITNHVIEGICIGSIVDGNENMNLQKKLLKKVSFAEVSTKVNEMMGRFNQLKINKFIFLSLHHYMERTKGYETQFLNNILRPIINDSDVQGVILNNVVFYEPLIKNNIVQASELRTEMIKLYNNSSDENMKALIERLNIIEPDKQISKEENR